MAFSKEIYEARRAQLQKTMESGLLLFLGNGIASMNYPDNNFQFRQDSTFYISSAWTMKVLLL